MIFQSKRCDESKVSKEREGVIIKAIIFSRWFEPTDELKNFCKSIGYNTNDYSSDFNLMFDPRVVRFCESKLSSLWNEQVYKGRKSDKSKIGFAGAGYIREVDITKKWKLKYNQVDAPIIDYVEACCNEYGYLVVKSI